MIFRLATSVVGTQVIGATQRRLTNGNPRQKASG